MNTGICLERSDVLQVGNASLGAETKGSPTKEALSRVEMECTVAFRALYFVDVLSFSSHLSRYCEQFLGGIQRTRFITAQWPKGRAAWLGRRH